MVKVKICGIRDEAALDSALDSGADFVGFVVFPKSPRHVEPATAARLVRGARRGGAKSVVLLVDPDDALVDDIRRNVAPDVIQLHGHESPDRVAEIAGRTDLTIWKAAPVAGHGDAAAAMSAFLKPGIRADLILYDAKPPADPGSLPGGNGLAFDWRMLADVTGGRPFALAGGLTPENVADAIRLVKPAVVDVSSGVEVRPGEKSPELIRRFIRAAKGASRRLG